MRSSSASPLPASSPIADSYPFGLNPEWPEPLPSAPLTVFARWFACQDAQVRLCIALNLGRCLRRERAFKRIAAQFEGAIDRLVFWLNQQPDDPCQTLSRLFVLRGALNLLVFRSRSRREDWATLTRESLHLLARAEREGVEELAKVVQAFLALPERAAVWMQAAQSWEQLCKEGQLSDEALEQWLEIAERQQD